MSHPVFNTIEDEYPDHDIIRAGKHEFIVELEPGKAIAWIGPGGSRPHFHLEMVETYRVLEGRLSVAVGGVGWVLKEGEQLRIGAPRIHVAASASLDGSWAKVQVLSDPPWSAEDHFHVG